MRPDFYTVHHGRTRLRVPRAWTTFVYLGRRYRVAHGVVETEDRGHWHESLLLAYSAPKGRPRC